VSRKNPAIPALYGAKKIIDQDYFLQEDVPRKKKNIEDSL
jgi:hypothetical protein